MVEWVMLVMTYAVHIKFYRYNIYTSKSASTGSLRREYSLGSRCMYCGGRLTC